MKLYVSIFDTMNVFDCDSLFLLVIKGSRYRTAIYDRAVPHRDRGQLGHVGQCCCDGPSHRVGRVLRQGRDRTNLKTCAESRSKAHTP